MINEELLREKLKYLITMNASKWFEVMDVYIEFEYLDDSKERIIRYDLDVTFDYHGRIDLELTEFVRDVEKMSDELKKILMEFVISKDGKIVSGKNSDVYVLDPLIFSAEFKADELHKFILGYKFLYE